MIVSLNKKQEYFALIPYFKQHTHKLWIYFVSVLLSVFLH